MTTPNRPVRLTTPVRLVLDALLAAQAEDPPWGYRICAETELGPGTVYPILERLEQAGWITGQWEADTPHARPARRLYTISDTGRQMYAEALARSSKRRGAQLRPAWLRSAGSPR
ncbi:helix-turn-helix transcriptional regulator [Nonomuraea sp. NPDC046802]|uniref:PadR family transcriptional regulator n=1 Tax=Nonomuraea sp. NPDC046802 TaxID=3154919 RepID=UPI003403690E